MRKLAPLILGFVFCLAGSALAAPPAWVWTGFYVGGNAGYSWGHDKGPLTLGPAFSVDSSTSLDGFIGGAQFGYNWQMATWIYGLETDFQGTGQKGNANLNCPGGTTTVVNSLCSAGHVGDTINDPARPVTATLSEKLEWLGTLRGRVGTTITPTLFPYLTGGMAYGHVKVDETVSGIIVSGTTGADGATFTPGGGTFGTGKTKVGWTIGAGLESLLSGNWTCKVEYLYVDLGTVSGSFTTSLIAPSGSNLVAGFSSHVTDHIVRVGVNYSFH